MSPHNLLVVEIDKPIAKQVAVGIEVSFAVLPLSLVHDHSLDTICLSDVVGSVGIASGWSGLEEAVELAPEGRRKSIFFGVGELIH